VLAAHGDRRPGVAVEPAAPATGARAHTWGRNQRLGAAESSAAHGPDAVVVGGVATVGLQRAGDGMDGGRASDAGRPPVAAVRRALTGLAMAALLVSAGAAVSGAGQPAAASASTPLYLALGDSLAVGVGASQPSDDYVDLVYRHQLARHPGLQLVDLACSGATTTSMIVGGEWCPYAAGTQLAAAESFIRSHPGRISFVTIDIGLNDIDGCMTDTTVDADCVADGLRKASTDLGSILAGLRSADRNIAIYGADYYDPFLAAWSNGAAGHVVARQSEADVLDLDHVLAQGYARSDVPVAKVATRFDTADFRSASTSTGRALPENVARVCGWTWMCSAEDLHPDNLGHAQLARAFDAVIDATRTGSSA